VSGRRAAAHPWWLGPAGALGAGCVWLLGHTWRIERVGMERDPELARSGCVFVLWHAQLLPLSYTSHRARL
jgi:hypothetical protein